jgi:serine/threonine-protein kinase
MEKGEPLDGDLTVEKRVEYFLKVCDAVEYAHSKGIVHRDLKPANIMIGRHNEVYLMDWGIARPMGAGGQSVEQGIELQVGDQPSNDLSRTRVGSAIGTPFYMSPEQAEGKNRDLDGRSDQYTMGLILQECVSLKRAVGGTTLQEVLTKAKEARRDPVMIGQSLGHVPPEVEAIVRKATRLDPKDRYPSVAALADDVRRFARGEAVLALPEGPVRRAGRWLAKHRMAALTLILGLGLVGAGGTIGALVIGQQRIEAEHARELRVSQLQTESAIQAQVVDRELSRYEEALAELVGATQAVLSRPPPPDAATYLDDAFTGKAPPAPGLAASKRYGKDVSVQAGVTSLAAGVTRDAAESALAQLASLTPELRALFLGSAGADWQRMSPAAQRAAITDAGVPAFRAAITLDQGVTLRFPGMAGQPTTDDRGSEWYRAAKGTRGVKWGQPVQGEKGALLPATEALYDERGTFRGVVTLEVSLERLLDRPESVALDFVESKQLIGRDGKLMAEDNAAGGERAPMAPEVLAAIAKGQSGGLVADVGGKKWQYAYYPLATLDWYYVAAGRVQRMMASKARVTTSDPRKLVAAAAPAPAVATVAPSATPTSPDVPDAGADAGDDAGPDGGDDAGAADAGIADAGAHDAGVLRDGGLPAYRKPGPMPKATAKPEVEANPFEPWKAYEKK